MESLKPQHVLAEVGPCGLPLDGSSAASLNENRSQYARAARAFEGAALDALRDMGLRADALDAEAADVREQLEELAVGLAEVAAIAAGEE